ncbi:MAG: hypothetical protein AB7V14_02705 [Kiritimatiellia bacterium]
MSRAASSVQVAISLDVEEDGLGCGRYPRVPPGVANVAALERLEFVTRDFGIPLTLLATYPVIMDDVCLARLVRWRDQRDAEIGAHLHPWNTPPFPEGDAEGNGNPTPWDGEKMATLRAAIEQRTGRAPVSFRMGRFAVSERMFDDVQRAGFRRDASVVPFHATSGALAAYAVSPNPYRLRAETDSFPALWEIPLTTLPVWPCAGRWMAAATTGLRRPWQAPLQRVFQRIGVAGLHPAWFALPVMCWAARLHIARGGRLLHVFMHSSDLMPGCTPAFPTEQSVQRQINRLAAFLRWLQRRYSVAGATLGAVRLD